MDFEQCIYSSINCSNTDQEQKFTFELEVTLMIGGKPVQVTIGAKISFELTLKVPPCTFVEWCVTVGCTVYASLLLESLRRRPLPLGWPGFLRRVRSVDRILAKIEHAERKNARMAADLETLL